MIGIISALSSELSSFLNVLENKVEKNIMGYTFYEGLINNKEVVLTKAGIGKMNATASTILLIEHYDVQLVINSGIAGGYEKSLKTLDTVLGTQVACYDIDMTLDGNPYGCIEKNQRLLTSKIQNLPNAISGLIMTADYFAYDREKLEKIFNKYYSDVMPIAVDMESYAIALVCEKYHKDWVVLRTISDLVGEDKQIQMYYNFPELASQKSFSIIMSNFFNK